MSTTSVSSTKTAVMDKENQQNAPPVAPSASNTSKKNCNKEMASAKDDGATDDTVSPYQRRLKLFYAARDAAGPDALLMMLNHGDDLLEKYNLIGDMECAGDLDDEEHKRAINSLSDAHVKDLMAMVVTPGLRQLNDKYRDDILYADDRWNVRGSGMVCLNTHSSWCMFPVISKQLTVATKEVNKAEKLVQASAGGEVPGVAKKAMETSVAAVMAAHEIDHWRIDLEEPDEVDKLAKRLVKLTRALLCFTDKELGWNDTFTRKSWIQYLKDLANDWKENAENLNYTLTSMNFFTKKNGNGLGRSLTVQPDSNPAPQKKQKVVQVVAIPNSNSDSASLKTLTTSFMLPQLDQRVKTVVQLAVVDLNKPQRVEHVVISGATEMKKLNQLLAYLTGSTNTFEYHYQRGSSVKGCRFELNIPGYRTCWLAPPNAAKEASKQGADFVTDKPLKIVQIFQGLNCSPNGGIIFDSEVASTIATTANGLVFVNQRNERYAVKLQAIAPKKTERGKAIAMPRVVVYGEGKKKSGFGMTLSTAKRILQGNRKDPEYMLMGLCSAKNHLKFWSEPICNMDGGFVFSTEGEHAFITKATWSADNVRTAGPPSSANI